MHACVLTHFSCVTLCNPMDCNLPVSVPETAMATHPNTLAWKIPWTEEPGGLQSMGSLGVRHNWATALSLFTFMHWRRKWQCTPVFLPGESQGWGSLVGFRIWVAQSWTRLKRLSSSSSSSLCPWDSPGKNTGVGCHALPLGDLLNPGIESTFPVLPGRFFTAEPSGKPKF